MSGLVLTLVLRLQVIYTALRMSERNGTPSKELLAAAEETRRFARDSVFENNPDLEVVQGASSLSPLSA